jgi:hypothetical protein
VLAQRPHEKASLADDSKHSKLTQPHDFPNKNVPQAYRGGIR